MRRVLQRPTGKTVREGEIERLWRERFGPQDLDDPDVACAALLERQVNSLVQEHVVFVAAIEDDDLLRPVPNKGLEDVADETNPLDAPPPLRPWCLGRLAAAWLLGAER